MTTINDRIGSQNVIRVLSNASAPPTRLNNLSDVNSLRKNEDGLILVWDTNTEKFILTDKIDGDNLIVTGISSFSNVTNSTSPTTGAVKISGGVGILKNLNVGGQLQVTGVSTFNSVTRFKGDYVSVDKILIAEDLFASEQVIGVSTGVFGSLKVWEGGSQVEVISSTRQLQNIVSLDATTISTIETAISNAPNTFTDLNITGISTFIGIATFASGIFVTSGISTFNNAIDAQSGILASTLSVTGETNSGTLKAGNLTPGRVVYVGSNGLLQDNGNLIFDGGLLTLSGSLNVSGITTFAGLVDINAGGQANTFKVEDLTSGRVVLAGTGGELEDSANLIFDGGLLTLSGSLNVSGITTFAGLVDINAGGQANTFKVEDLTSGRVVLAGTGGEIEDSGNLTFNGSLLTVTGNQNVTGTLTAGLIDGGSY